MDFLPYKTTNRIFRFGVTIPDSNFFHFLTDTYDLVVDRDGKISFEDTLRITEIDCPHRGIKSFAGIEFFPNLTYLDCGWNRLEKLDLWNNRNLQLMSCLGCGLSYLNVANCYFLSVLNCSVNKLRTLNIDECYSLRFLCCRHNRIKELDVTPCSDSIYVDYGGNPNLIEITRRIHQRSI